MHGVVEFGSAGSVVLHTIFMVAGWRMRPEWKEGAQWLMAVIAMLGKV